MSDRTQREIAEQVGCDQAHVCRIKQQLMTSHQLPEAPSTVTGTDSLGRNQLVVRTIGEAEAQVAAALHRAHAGRLAVEHALERRLAAAHTPQWSSVPGAARAGVERCKRQRLRAELRAMIDQPLIRDGILTDLERREIWLREGFRYRPVRGK